MASSNMEAFDPPAKDSTITATLYPNSTTRMDLYTYTPPATCSSSSSASSASPLSWVTATYTPPAVDSTEYSTHDILIVPAHWHEFHDEIMTVVSGRMQFTVNGHTMIVSAGDDHDLRIPRGTVHGFQVLRGEPVCFRERTVPQGGFKGEFFKDLFRNGEPSMLHALRTASEADMYMALPLPWGGSRWLDYWVTRALGAVAKMVLPYRETPPMVPAAPGRDFEDGKKDE